MISKDEKGAGMVEILLVLPLFILFITGTYIVFKITASKNIALNDASQINLITHRQNRVIRNPLNAKLKVDNENITVERRENNSALLDSFLRAPLAWQSEVKLAFTPKKNPLFAGGKYDPGRFSEKNLLLIDSWDVKSRFGRRLKQSIDLTHAAILLSLLGR